MLHCAQNLPLQCVLPLLAQESSPKMGIEKVGKQGGWNLLFQ